MDQTEARSTMTEDVLLNAEQAARLLGCTAAALALWRREDRGPAYIRLGRLIRYRKSDVFAWISSRRVPGEAQGAHIQSADAA